MTGDETSPFPGLRPFRADEESLFFGRDREVASLVDRVQKSGFLALVGPSGSGKSSLLQAGLLPRLARGELGSLGGWRCAAMRVGLDPFVRLARALLASGVIESYGDPDDPWSDVEAVASELRLGADAAIALLRAGQSTASPVLVIVDQFEELLTGTSSLDVRRAFGHLLVDMTARAGDVHVLISMRAEFLGVCSEYPGLAEAINRSIFLLAHPDDAALRTCIERPLRARGVSPDVGFAELVVAAFGRDPDQLALLSHAMRRTWLLRGDRARIGARDFAAAGGRHALANELDQTALRVAGDALDRAGSTSANGTATRARAEEQLAAELVAPVFGPLFALTEQGGVVRRPGVVDAMTSAPPKGHEADRKRLVDACLAADLLVAVDGERTPTVEVAHEALLRTWPRLKELVHRRERDLRELQALEAAAERYQRNWRSLYTLGEIRLAMDASRRVGRAPSAQAKAFLGTSLRVVWAVGVGMGLAAFALIVGLSLYAKATMARHERQLHDAQRSVDRAQVLAAIATGDSDFVAPPVPGTWPIGLDGGALDVPPDAGEPTPGIQADAGPRDDGGATVDAGSIAPAATPDRDAARALWVRGNALYRAGNDAQAMPLLRTSSSRDATYAPPENTMGLICWNNDNLPAAVRHFQEALRRDPSYGPARRNLASVSYLLGDTATATHSATYLVDHGTSEDQTYARRLLAGMREAPRD